jgi:hypothetical protein
MQQEMQRQLAVEQERELQMEELYRCVRAHALPSCFP